MKISIETRGETYTYQSDHEGLCIDEIVTNFKGLLVAAGFHPQSVDEAVHTEHCWFADNTRPEECCSRAAEYDSAERVERFQQNMYKCTNQ